MPGVVRGMHGTLSVGQFSYDAESWEMKSHNTIFLLGVASNPPPQIRPSFRNDIPLSNEVEQT